MEHNNKDGWSLQATRIHKIRWTSLLFLFYSTVNEVFTSKDLTFQLAGTFISVAS